MQSKLQELGLPESFCFAPYINLDLDQITRIQNFLNTEYQSDKMHIDSVEYIRDLDALYGMRLSELAPELTEWIK